jgi:hypothetical protein
MSVPPQVACPGVHPPVRVTAVATHLMINHGAVLIPYCQDFPDSTN